MPEIAHNLNRMYNSAWCVAIFVFSKATSLNMYLSDISSTTQKKKCKIITNYSKMHLFSMLLFEEEIKEVF
jgi:hypothetical protein